MITTNHRVRELVALGQIDNPEVHENFDYFDEHEISDQRLVKYRGDWLDTHDTMPVTQVMVLHEPDLANWSTYSTDGMFWGHVFRFVELDYGYDLGVIVGVWSP